MATIDTSDFASDNMIIQGCYSPWRGHDIVKDTTHGYTDHSDSESSVSPFGCFAKNVVQHVQHVLVVSNLLLAHGICQVRRLLGNLVPHGGKVHIDARVGLNLWEFCVNELKPGLVEKRTQETY
jgi:hypothetical protein